MVSGTDIRRYLENWQEEVDSAAQYRAMAVAEKRPRVAGVYTRLGKVEEKHAAFWEEKLRAAGREPGPRRPSWRARTLAWIAVRFGADLVLPTIASTEYADRNNYLRDPETRGTHMTQDERSHARVLQSLLVSDNAAPLGRVEGRHRTVGSNALRAAVLGANDGLCSNLALVAGVAGAAVDHRTIVLTGVAGLLAGACSMALGEWISVTSAREHAEREMRIEKSELEENPEEEREELELIYEAKGLSPNEARDLSKKLMQSEKTALDALTREELGIDPDELGGSPWVAALTSLFLFAGGAIVPLLPFFFLRGVAATGASVGFSGVALFGIGAAITLFTGKRALASGARQVALGFAAAGATYGIGRLIGVAVG